MPSPDSQVTQLLNRISSGDVDAHGELLPLLYDELRALARARMARMAPNQTLQPTALVHEVYLRLEKHPKREWEDRRHFFFVVSRAMRDILVENARRKSSLKRGGDLERLDIDHVDVAIDSPMEDMLALDLALEELEREDPDGHQMVMLRYFAGQTMEEIAQTLEVSLSTVERRWRFLRAWLATRLEGGDGP